MEGRIAEPEWNVLYVDTGGRMPVQENRRRRIMEKRKYRYKGTFNFQRQVYLDEYCYAYSERQAWLTFCRRLAKRHGVSLSWVTGYFDGETDNYKITKEQNLEERI
jgi:hypothetical protein